MREKSSETKNEIKPLNGLRRNRRWPLAPAILWGGLLLGMTAFGCQRGEPDASSPRSAGEDSPVPVAPVDTAGPQVSPAELRRRLNANENARFHQAGGRIRFAELSESGVTDLEPLAGLPLKGLDLRGLPLSDLSPLEGMPLEQLFLEETQVSDVGSLRGMPLEKLYLNHTPVGDLGPLADMKIRELNLFGTNVADLEIVGTMSVRTLWLRDTPVADLGPLEEKPLESLDVENTSVSDLGPLAQMSSLRRLNIAGSDVTDLTPLRGLRLERLIFTPANITDGIDIVREMRSLQELDVEFREPERLSPAEFWQRYDAGAFSE